MVRNPTNLQNSVVENSKIYAKMRVIGKCCFDNVNEFDYWSIEAEEVWKQAQLKIQRPNTVYSFG
tara:strand:- start:44 stop:238 length:195 start_codon:yes stop_codon:yes gene_type:complete